MSRAPAAKPARAVPSRVAHCPDNDCQRQQAEALNRLADHLDHLFGLPGAEPEDQGEAMKALVTLGEIGGKWLSFCAFVRKWFPRGWWLLPILVTLLTKGSSEATDALIQAATTALQSYVASGG